MPIESKRQQGFMYAHQNDPGRLGQVAREFISATPKSAYKKMPERKKAAKPRSFGSLRPRDDGDHEYR